MLEKYRKQIDKKDRELLEVLAERFSVIKKVSQYKKEKGLPAQDEKREKEMFEKRREWALELNLDPDLALSIFQLIVGKAKQKHRELKKSFKKIEKFSKVGYLGPEGTFSHQAVLAAFSEVESTPLSSIEEIFERLDKGEIDVGFVPAENTLGGVVTETVNSLIEYPFHVIGSFDLKISHCLLGRGQKQNLKVIKSHAQALSQCRKWLKENLPNARLEKTQSTASDISQEREVGFIGSEAVAKAYNLNILAKDIQDNKENLTKFYLLSKENRTEENLNHKRTLLLLAVYNRVGILRDILNVFAENSLNLTCLHSIPSRIKSWDYLFFLEVEAPQDSLALKKTLKGIEEFCTMIRIIGKS